MFLFLSFFKIIFDRFRPGKKETDCLASIHQKFFQLGKAFFSSFFFYNETYFVLNIQLGTSLHLKLSDYDDNYSIVHYETKNNKKKKCLKSLVVSCIQLNLHQVKYSVQFSVSSALNKFGLDIFAHLEPKGWGGGCTLG